MGGICLVVAQARSLLDMFERVYYPPGIQPANNKLLRLGESFARWNAVNRETLDSKGRAFGISGFGIFFEIVGDFLKTIVKNRKKRRQIADAVN